MSKGRLGRTRSRLFGLLSPPVEHSAAMSTDPRFKCSQCKKCKLSDEYGTCQREGSHGQKGDCLNICLSCTTVNSANRKQKRMESNPDHPVKRSATQPAFSPIHFVKALDKHASASENDVPLRVSLAGTILTDKDIADHVASLAWNAMSYNPRLAYCSLEFGRTHLCVMFPIGFYPPEG